MHLKVRPFICFCLSLAVSSCFASTEDLKRLDSLAVSILNLVDDIAHLEDVGTKEVNPFIKWLEDGGSKIQGLEILERGGSGLRNRKERKVVALMDIPEGAEIVAIPRHLLISSTGAKQDGWVAELHKTGISSLLSWPSGNFILVQLAHDILQSGTEHTPYYDILPKDYSYLPGTWCAMEDATPAAAFALEMVNEKANEELLAKIARDMDERCQKWSRDFKIISMTLPEFERTISFSQYAQLRALISSRSFGLDDNDGHFSALVPFGDMLNHDSQPSTRWRFDPQQDAFVMLAKRPISKGEEVTDYYGRVNSIKDQSRFFLNYGFVHEL